MHFHLCCRFSIKSLFNISLCSIHSHTTSFSHFTIFFKSLLVSMNILFHLYDRFLLKFVLVKLCVISPSLIILKHTQFTPVIEKAHVIKKVCPVNETSIWTFKACFGDKWINGSIVHFKKIQNITFFFLCLNTPGMREGILRIMLLCFILKLDKIVVLFRFLTNTETVEFSLLLIFFLFFCNLCILIKSHFCVKFI